MERVEVNAEALRRVLVALNGPAHYIRELQVTRNLPPVDDHPINRLILDWNDAVEEFNASSPQPA